MQALDQAPREGLIGTAEAQAVQVAVEDRSDPGLDGAEGRGAGIPSRRESQETTSPRSTSAWTPANLPSRLPLLARRGVDGEQAEPERSGGRATSGTASRNAASMSILVSVRCLGEVEALAAPGRDQGADGPAGPLGYGVGLSISPWCSAGSRSASGRIAERRRSSEG